MSAIRLKIGGLVQGVGFRAFVLREARLLGLKGWVRNRMDGTVEALASGPQEALEAFVARCREGPRAARVLKVEVSASEDEGFSDFRQLPAL